MTEGEASPEAAFALFGHELRVSILLALAEADGRSLSFAELRRAVDEPDSGKFNYHLSKLVGKFVARDEEADEYALRYPGHRVVDVVRNGVFHEDAAVEDVALDADCVDCGGPLQFDYDANTAASVRCRDCERLLLAFPFDPGGLRGRDGREAARAFDLETRLAWQQAHGDVCPVCSGRVDRCPDDDERQDLAATHDYPVLLSLDCTECSFFTNVPPGAVLLWHPAVVAFCHERGVDVRERRLWECPFVVDPDAIAVAERDPWRLRVRVEVDGDERRAVLDGEGVLKEFS